MLITLKQLLYTRYLIPGFRVLSPTVPSMQRPRRPWARWKHQGWNLNPYDSNSKDRVKERLPGCAYFCSSFSFRSSPACVLAPLSHSVLGGSSWSMHRCLQCSWGHHSLVEGTVKSVVLEAQSCGDLNGHCRSGTASNQVHSHRKEKSWAIYWPSRV